MKVMITGSRDWPCKDIVYAELDRIVHELNKKDRYEHLIIVNGMCPTGADFFAHQYYLEHSLIYTNRIEEEPHPPDFKRYGKPAAYHVRNSDMVMSLDPELDYFLVFNLNNSNGTSSTTEKALAAKIRGKVIEMKISIY